MIYIIMIMMKLKTFLNETKIMYNNDTLSLFSVLNLSIFKRGAPINGKYCY